MEITNQAMKAVYLATAELSIEIFNIYSMMGIILTLCIASIIIGLVMLKGVFGKRIGYLVIAAGILTLFTPVGLALTAIWQLLVGFKLYKLGKDIYHPPHIGQQLEWVKTITSFIKTITDK